MRKGFEGLAALVQQHLDQDPFSGQLFAFRGRRGDLEKVLSWDKLSLRDLIRGIVFGCEAVRDWETKLSLALPKIGARQRGKKLVRQRNLCQSPRPLVRSLSRHRHVEYAG